MRRLGPQTQHVTEVARMIAHEAFRLPRFEALDYLRAVDEAANDHSDAISFKTATNLVRRDLFRASAP